MAERERGSVLMLMPAAVLVFLILGALCVDYGGVYVAQRELANAAAAAANDAATQAIDLPHFYATGEVVLLDSLANDVAQRSVAAKGLDRYAPVVRAEVRDQDHVVVTIEGQAPYLFAKAVPGGKDHAPVSTTSEAEAADGP